MASYGTLQRRRGTKWNNMASYGIPVAQHGANVAPQGTLRHRRGTAWNYMVFYGTPVAQHGNTWHHMAP